MRLLFALVCAAAMTSPPTEAEPRGARTAPVPAPMGRTLRVEAGADLQAALDGAREGDVVSLAPAHFEGHFVIRRPITLSGEGAILDGRGQGTVLRVEAAGVRLLGLSVRGSGSDLAASDACIWLGPQARYAEVRGNHLSSCAFGVWVHATADVVIADNRVEGKPAAHPSERGNGIHLFDATHASVLENVVRGARDGVYVSATEESLIRGNVTSGLRYGVHYMFSHRNTVEANVSEHNSGGYALMESQDIVVRRNIARHNREQGILFRSARGCTIEDNVSSNNGQGMFFYDSTSNVIRNNRLEHNEVGMKIWAGTRDNDVRHNVLRGNRRQIFYVASTDLHLAREGQGNYWSDYLGWDQDQDGIGDRPYRVDSFTSTLLYRYPTAALLLKSPALELLSHLEARLPVLRTPTVIDHHPIVQERAAR